MLIESFESNGYIDGYIDKTSILTNIYVSYGILKFI